MKLIFKGKAEDFTVSQEGKLRARLLKLGKTVEHRGEREARAIVTKERHLNNVELTLSAFDHSLAVKGSDRDLFTAVNQAIDKLEKQLQKMATKWRTTKRHKEAPHRTPEEAEATGNAVLLGKPVVSLRKLQTAKAAKVKPQTGSAQPKQRTVTMSRSVEVFHVTRHDGRKPMTLEEAMMEIGERDAYLSYIDAETDRVTVLLRRKDGHFDLVEG
jgi:putative sigma-54 modulation protein